MSTSEVYDEGTGEVSTVRPYARHRSPVRENELARIRLRAPFGGTAVVEVNGTDIAEHTVSLGLEMGGLGTIPHLTLDLVSGVDIDMTGVVQLLPMRDGRTGADRASVLVEWLDSVDVQSLEAAVLGGAMSMGPVQAVLEELRRRALAAP